MVNKSIVIAIVAILMVAAVGFILLSEDSEAGDLKITIVAQVNSEGSGIFVKNSIANETQLGGKIFATPGTSSIQHMMLMDFVTAEGYQFKNAPSSGPYDPNTVYWTQIAPAMMKSAITGGEILLHGGIVWEPYVSTIIYDSSTDCKILKWTSELWSDHPCCVVAVNTAFMERNPETVQRFVASHAIATQWLVDTIAAGSGANYTHILNIACNFTGVLETDVMAALEVVKYDYRMNTEWMASLEQVVETYDELGLLAEGAMAHWGFNNYSDIVDRLVNNTFVDNIANVTVVDPSTPLKTVRVGWLYGDIHQLACLVANDGAIGQGLGYGANVSIYEAYGLNIESGAGNPYANGGAVMNVFYADVIDIGFLGSPPAILRSVNQF